MKVDFVSITAIRESHRALFGASDFYCIAICKLSDPITSSNIPIPQPGEIKTASWVPIKTLVHSKYFQNGLYGQMLFKSLLTGLKANTGGRQGIETDSEVLELIQQLDKKISDPSRGGRITGAGHFQPSEHLGLEGLIAEEYISKRDKQKEVLFFVPPKASL